MMMQSVRYFLIILFGLAFFYINADAQQVTKDYEWQSIIILQSTRADVEKQFGKPTETSFTSNTTKFYKLKNFNLRVLYSGEPCSGDVSSELQIPVDRVVYFNVLLSENINIPLSEMIGDKSDYEKTDSLPSVFYDSEIDGIAYEVFPKTEIIRSINYRPKKKIIN